MTPASSNCRAMCTEDDPGANSTNVSACGPYGDRISHAAAPDAASAARSNPSKAPATPELPLFFLLLRLRFAIPFLLILESLIKDAKKAPRDSLSFDCIGHGRKDIRDSLREPEALSCNPGAASWQTYFILATSGWMSAIAASEWLSRTSWG